MYMCISGAGVQHHEGLLAVTVTLAVDPEL